MQEMCIEDKVSDKKIMTHLVTAVAVIFICIAALSYSAYAWFVFNVSSNANSLIAAQFDIKALVSTGVNLLPEDKVYNLSAGEYRIELSRTDTTAQNGFCIMKVTVGADAPVSYHTVQIPDDAALVIDLSLSENTTVEFIPCIGTSCYYGTDGNPLYVEFNVLDLRRTTQNTLDQQTQQPTDQIKHLVVEGDTLIGLAEKYGSTVDAIVELNNIEDRRTIVLGQELIIPTTESSAEKD